MPVREWAVETGKVERVCRVDGSMTKTLIEESLNSVEHGRQSNGPGGTEPLLIIESRFDVINSLIMRISSAAGRSLPMPQVFICGFR
jgi:hypothetical protein